jgi:hypothetical protein
MRLVCTVQASFEIKLRSFGIEKELINYDGKMIVRV